MKLWPDEYEDLRAEAREMIAGLLGAMSDGFGGDVAADASVEEKVAGSREAMANLFAPVEEAEVREIAGLPCRVFVPDGPATAVYLHFHGGGMIIGASEMNDVGNLALSRHHGLAVVSVDYRLAPEHPAPAALDDVMAALTWTAENAELLGADVSRLAVGGDSAGGHLAAQLCQRSLREFGPDIDFQLLVYPVTDLSLSHPSIEENAEGYFLTKRSMEWFRANYIGDLDPRDPALSPLFAPDLAGLPAALVITAEYDPLRDEGEAYAQRLQEAGVPTQLVRYDGQIHGFFAMPTMLEDGRHAVGLASAALRSVLT